MDVLKNCIAVIGEGAAHFADALASYFADVVLLPPFSPLDARIASHPDTLFARVGDVLVVSEAYADHAPQAVERIAAHARVCFGKTVPRSPYPHDVAYNVFSHGGRLYGRTDAWDAAVLAAATEQGMPVRAVRQGYAGCCALSCGDFVLTADPSLADALTADGASVLCLTAGGIRLSGYDCGFIGGAGGFCARTAIFFGNIDTHPDGRAMRETFEKAQIDVLSLGTDILCDFGGIFTIPTQKGCKRSAAVL